jgi:hypothetical protein
MALSRQDIRESIERAGDEHWEALVSHHTDVYPDERVRRHARVEPCIRAARP